MKGKLLRKGNNIFFTLLLSLFSGSTLAENSSKTTLLLANSAEINKESCCHFQARHHRMIVDVIKTGNDEKYYLAVYLKHKSFNDSIKGKKIKPGEWGLIKIYNLKTGEIYKERIIPDARYFTNYDYWAYSEKEIGGRGFSWELVFKEPGQYLVSLEADSATLNMDDMVFTFIRKLWSK